MSLEIEYKFLIESIPDFIKQEKPFIIKQTYFKKEPIEKLLNKFFTLDFKTIDVVRLRKVSYNQTVKFILTLKTKGLIERNEFEKEIKKIDYEIFFNYPFTSSIEKQRYIYNYQEYKFEFDEITNLKQKLSFVEVEVLEKDEYVKILKYLNEILDCDFIDVSLDVRYKNNNIYHFFNT